MSGITDSRLALGEALDAADLRVAYDPGLITPPAVLVAPADPWVTPSRLATRSRALRWRLVAVGGRADVAVTLGEVEDLVAAVILATVDMPDGWGAPTFDAPGTIDLGGSQYLAAVGRIDHLTEV